MAHSKKCSLAIVASVLVAGAPLRSAETTAEVPFELYQRHLVVTKGSIGRLQGLNLLIDTGTIPSMVDTRSPGSCTCRLNQPRSSRSANRCGPRARS